MINLDNKTVLVTGGAGFFGKNFVKFLLNETNAKKIIIFSRDEFKQHQMDGELSNERLRFFIGDVRDLQRLQRAFARVDVVVHAAALKQVPALEYNPFEAVKTNIVGSQNVIEAAIDQGVGRVLLISSDKAVQPSNLYGASKLCAEKLFVSANAYSPQKTVFSCVRYGNVVASRGSIIEILLKNKNAKKVMITHPEMTRFWITLEQSFGLVMSALKNMEGGEIFVPKIPSMKIVDLFDVITPEAEKEEIGIRPGEKLHEVLLTEHEARCARDLGGYFVVLPPFEFTKGIYQKYYDGGVGLSQSFCYASDTNTDWLTNEQLKQIIAKMYPNF